MTIRSRALLATSAAILLTAVGAVACSNSPEEPQGGAAPSSSTSPESSSTESATESSTEKTSEESTEETSEAKLDVEVAPSAAKEMVIPSLNIDASFEGGPCRTTNGAIDPATMDLACTYTADDKPYVLPGSTAEDITVIAGHTGSYTPGVFDNLYDGATFEHKITLGDVMYLRTEASGENWLAYTATDTHEPEKPGLAYNTAIWGDEPMPGRLLTISCIQPADFSQLSVRNAVVGWQFDGVVPASEVHA
ncbi:hypothetical protein QP027_00285 [Corynebacterium breve]|uniref:Sortase n=1 Tax=Corynebacterium breve TaxID=3049799 RepID=A0ABY8VJX8_9CORY|nr:hypothetical protein [Corynebacterium breve]WIM67880.1 hypothetical protein QP027_00285 [Corynebacterium breve]